MKYSRPPEIHVRYPTNYSIKSRGESNQSIAKVGYSGRSIARISSQVAEDQRINHETVNVYVLKFRDSGKDFPELSRLDEDSLACILPEPKLFQKPMAYQNL